jgi:putative copper export protein
MNFVIILLRVIHIFAAAYWAGAAFFLVRVLLPTVQEAGPDGGKFMQRLALSGRLSRGFAIASGLTVLSGILAYLAIPVYRGNPFAQFGQAAVLTIGAVFGLLAFLHGMLITGPISRRSGALAKEMATHQGPPDPEKLKEAQALGAKLGESAVHSAILIALALLGMAAAQYFSL